MPAARFHATIGLLSLVLAGNLVAADRYIAPTGLDTNPGSLEKPWKTFPFATGKLMAGDSLFLRGGVYSQRLVLDGKHATAAAPIVIRNYNQEAAIIDGAKIEVPTGGRAGLVVIANCDHVHLHGLDIRNFVTSTANRLPAGIQVLGAGTGTWVMNCKVHHIWQSTTSANGNGFGIAVYGSAASPIDKLILDGNEVFDLRTGSSESVVLNGNVTNFSVTNNKVHDCNNIGIDFIGFEGSNANATLDQARGGVCSGNVIYKIDSKFNPSYGGNFTNGGNDDTRSAPGLYVDGGKDIVMERNLVYDCNFAASVGSEHKGKVTSNVTVRDNLFHHCHVGGIVIGGSDTSNGGAENCSFTNNTLYDNDSVGFGGGQIMIQHYVKNSVIKRNLMISTADFVQFVLKGDSTGSFAAGAIDFNLYQLRDGADFEFYWNGSAKASFANWKSAGSLAKDIHSALIRTSLRLVGGSPGIDAAPAGFALAAGSPAIDTGAASGFPFVPTAAEKDFNNAPRLNGAQVDIGAFEFGSKP